MATFLPALVFVCVSSQVARAQGPSDSVMSSLASPSLITHRQARGKLRPAVLRASLAAPIICVLFGLTISIMPHFVWLSHTGSPVWIADNDELLYFSYASQAYFNHPDHLSDPVVLTEKPAFYPRLQFVPGIALARGLSLGPMAVSLIWRAF